MLIEHQQNPTISASCEGLEAGKPYCVEVCGEPEPVEAPKPISSTSTTTTTTSSTSTTTSSTTTTTSSTPTTSFYYCLYNNR